MNKKFINGFLLASLVVGSSGFLSSCKDYDDDINQLRTEVAENKSAIQNIKDQIAAGAILKDVQQTANGIKVIVTKNGADVTYDITNGAKGDKGDAGTPADVWTIVKDNGKYMWAKNGNVTEFPAQGPAGENGTNGTDGTNGINGTDGLNGNYWAPNDNGTKLLEFAWNAEAKKYEATGKEQAIAITVEGDKTPTITAINNGNYVYLTGVKVGEENGKPVYGEVVISCNGLLKSIGFIPDLYVDGVEGTRSAYVKENYLKAYEDKKEGNLAIADNKTVEYYIKADDNWKYIETTEGYQLSENTVAKFDLNPDNANIKGVEFEFLPIENIEQVAVSRAAAPALKVKGEPEVKDGNLVVTYNVENPAAVTYGTSAEATLPITALTAKLAANEGETAEVLTSDYYSLVMARVKFTAFSFIGTNPCKKLAVNGGIAVENDADLDIVYTQAPEKTDLSKKIQICYQQADFGKDLTNATEKHMSIAQAAEKWGLSVNYDMMPYYVGDSETNDSQYAIVGKEDGIIDLQYINASNQWVSCGDNAASRSAIGKHPVVRVTLLNGTKPVLVGYVKINITDKGQAPSTIKNKPIILKVGTPMPYVCQSNAEVESTWQNTSSQVLSVLGMSEKQFKDSYKIKEGIYVEAANSTAEAPKFELVPSVTVNGNSVPKYGDLVYNPDSEAGPTNGFLTWTYDVDAAGEIAKLTGRKVSLYRKFTRNGNDNDNLYLGVTIEIMPAPTAKFVEIDPVFLADGKTNEVGMRVPQAKNTLGMSVEDFYAKLADYYVGDKINVKYVDKTGEGYPAADAANIKQSYSFAPVAAQLAGLTLNDDATELYKGLDKIATIDATTGKVTYVRSAASMELLNSEAGVSAMVQINATYGSCNLDFAALEDNQVKIDFKKPVEIMGNEGYTIYPDGINPSREALGNFFTMQDSYGNDIFSKKGNSFVDPYGIFDYYEIMSFSIDFTKAKASGVTFSLQGDGATETPKGSGIYTVAPATGDFLTIDALNDVQVVCDYGNEYLEKNQEVYIPVTIEYYWGKQTTLDKKEYYITISAFPKK